MNLHLAANIRSEIHSSHREIKEDMRQYMKQLVASSMQGLHEVGGDPGAMIGDSETSLALGKFNFARKEKEREMQQLIDR